MSVLWQICRGQGDIFQARGLTHRVDGQARTLSLMHRRTASHVWESKIGGAIPTELRAEQGK
jgi:hypothetical protein